MPVLNAPGYIEREWSSFLFDDLNVESEEKAEILSSLSREKRSRISQSINFEIGNFPEAKATVKKEQLSKAESCFRFYKCIELITEH